MAAKESKILPDGQKPEKKGGWVKVRGFTKDGKNYVVWERQQPTRHDGKKPRRRT